MHNALEKIADHVRRSGYDWRELERSASQIILFGSRSCNLHSATSDYDVLMVGAGPRIKNKNLDLMWASAGDLLLEEWLTSELISHVGEFGVWLRGPDDWRVHSRPDNTAIAKKSQRIDKHVSRLADNWKWLTNGYRRRELVRLRRDLLRLSYLRRLEAVPPTPVLDTVCLSQRNVLEDLITEFAVPNAIKARLSDMTLSAVKASQKRKWGIRAPSKT